MIGGRHIRQHLGKALQMGTSWSKHQRPWCRIIHLICLEYWYYMLQRSHFKFKSDHVTFSLPTHQNWCCTYLSSVGPGCCIWCSGCENAVCLIEPQNHSPQSSRTERRHWLSNRKINHQWKVLFEPVCLFGRTSISVCHYKPRQKTVGTGWEWETSHGNVSIIDRRKLKAA